MKRNFLSVASLAFIGSLSLSLMSGCTSDEEPKFSNGNPNWELKSSISLTRSEEEAVDNFNEFGYNLMNEAFKESSDGEFCISPVSLSIYLSMLANASTGTCHDQIMQALGADNIDNLNSLCRKLMQYLPNDDNESSLAINNHFWVAKHNKAPKDFTSIMNNYFNCGVDYVDFNKRETVDHINKWVSDCTKGNIPGIMFKDWEYYREREMVNANTVYFKGDWDHQFYKGNTKSGIFHSPNGDVDADMMHTTLDTEYFENESVKFIRLSFEGYSNVMDLYLPAESSDLSDLIKNLTPSMIDEIYNSSEYCTVSLSMPKFKKYFGSNVNTLLNSIGITSLEKVDLSPMGLRELPQFLIHNTSIKVDEDGAEMAAVTANVGETAPGPNDYRKVSLDLNHPFLYMIRNEKTNATLMVGTLTYLE